MSIAASSIAAIALRPSGSIASAATRKKYSGSLFSPRQRTSRHQCFAAGAAKHWWREVRWRGEKSDPEYFFRVAAEAIDPDGRKAIAAMDEAAIDISCTMPMNQGYR